MYPYIKSLNCFIIITSNYSSQSLLINSKKILALTTISQSIVRQAKMTYLTIFLGKLNFFLQPMFGHYLITI